MTERLKVHDWKSCVPLIRVPGVRIPPSPPINRQQAVGNNKDGNSVNPREATNASCLLPNTFVGRQYQPIADPALRSQELLCVWNLYFLSQVRHVDAQILGLLFRVRSPDCPQ